VAIEAVGNMPGAVLLGTLATLGLAMAVFSLLPLSPAQKGALVLASSFGNVTYLGLPLLQGLVPALGLQTAKVAVLCEVTTTPLNLSVGLSTGSRYAAAAASAPPAAEGDFADRAALAR
jgi:malate permease and related proteins